MGYFIKKLLDPYSDKIIGEYVSKLSDEINEQEFGAKSVSDREIPWMREDILTSKLYSCKVEGQSVSLQEMLFGSRSMQTRQNIVIIMGEKHIGKQYFVKELLKICQESVQKKKRGLIPTDGKEAYRIPIVLNYEKHWKPGEKLEVSELIVEAIKEKNIKVDIDKGRSLVKESVEKLLQLGRFFIYFEGKNWLREQEEELKEALNYGQIVGDYSKKAKYRNLVFLTVDSDIGIKESFLNEQFYTVIYLHMLTEDEVKNYLQKHLPALLPLVEKEKKIMEILCYPEHLKMFEALYDKSLIADGSHNELKNDFEFYDYFLRANIRKKISDVENDRMGDKKPNACKARENAVLDKLQKYAIGLYLENKKEEINPSRYFSFSDFLETGILDKEGEFVFPLCGYYLVAQNIAEQLKKNELSEIPSCLLEEPLENILIWTGRMIDEMECFNRFWDCLNKNSSCKLLLLAKIINVTRFKKIFEEKLYKKAFLSLQEDFYDYSVLEMLGELGDEGVEYLNHKYLTLEDEYVEIPKNNIKKRLVYFFGISHKGIIGRMLDELMKEETDLHLKYHIIRAAVENYGVHQKSTELISERFEQLKNYCGVSKDPIIKSDFCLLYEKHKKQEWISPENAQILMGELEAKMNDEVYWIRAHAAGAIGRRNHSMSYNLLKERIEEELKLIYDRNGDYRNSIKVISYSVEAICELSENLEEVKKECICHLSGLLDMERLTDQDIEDAYSTIATGIEYMINPDAEKLPFNLGDRFRNHTLKYRKVLLNTFRKMELFLEEDEKEMRKIKEKRERLEAIMTLEEKVQRDKKSTKNIRILHLTDLHYTTSNSDNNLLIKAVQKLKEIDMLVITGDLKQFGESYENTLAILNNLTKNLGLKPKDVFMVPGNQDCDNYEDKEKIMKDIRDNMYEDKEYYREHLDMLYQGLQGYKRFLEDFYGENGIEQGGMHNRLLSWGDCLHILSMNTALLCDKDSEKNKMVDINELTSLERKDDLPVLCIAHHKLSQLYLDHEDTVKEMFGELKVSAMLSGDIHRNMVEEIHINPYSIPNYICAKFLGDTNDHWSERSVAIYEIDIENKTLTPNLYKWERSRLVPDNTFRQRPEDAEGDWVKNSVKLL